MKPLRRATPALALVLLASGCTGSGSSTTPPDGAPGAEQAAKQLAAALTRGDVSALPMTGSAPLAQGELQTLMGGMDGLHPTVTPGTISYDSRAKTATAPLQQSLTLGTATWTWQTTATWHHLDGAWKLDWNPKIVEADLDGSTRLRHRREVPVRAAITGADGQALVEQRTAHRIGLDKSLAPRAQWEASARRLAVLAQVDAAGYAKKVAAAGPLAFVPAVTVRQAQIPQGLGSIPGARSVPVDLPLAPSSTFALGILGSAGEASPELVKTSHGDVLAGDVVGLSGLQKRYDAQLRGTVGHSIELVARTRGTKDEPGASPSPSASSSPAATPQPRVLFTTPAKPGTPVATSLDRTLQERAETVLAGQKGVASIVVLKNGTGDILATANSTASGANPDATAGRYTPGSTFKVVTSLALLRKGMTPTSTVPCTATTTVGGRSFKNYADFPASAIGRITLTRALATSCNTAFLSQHARLGAGDLAGAAASLGLGKDQDAGFSSFFGSVPPAGDEVTAAADMIGQGTVETSPMAMAAVASSVASGRTVLPWLVASKKPVADAKALTATEATALQTMMGAVVDEGSGRSLKGLATGAKTGTAEFGTATPPRTHAWMIAWNKQYAVAAMVAEGSSGSGTAGPLVKALLTTP